MDNMATGFAFGMGGDDFGNMDFQASMAGNAEGGQAPMMPGMGQFPHFPPAMSRDTMFSQASLMSPRGVMDLPRFSGGPYMGGSNSISGNFHPMMSARHSFSGGGMSSFGDMFPPQISGLSASEAGGGGNRMGGMMDSLADQMSNFGAVMTSTASSSPSVMPSSMPVFPNNPPSMMHTAMGPQDMNHKHEDTASELGSLKMNSAVMPEQKTNLQSPRQSPPQTMQTCFPGQMPPPLPQQQADSQLSASVMQQPNENHSPRAGYKEEKDFSGGPSDPISPLVIGNEITPMQRRRQPQRRAAMIAQEMAAAAAHALAIETKQVPMPPMLSSRDSHLLDAIPHNIAFQNSMASQIPMFSSAPQQSMQGFPYTACRRTRRTRTMGMNSGNVTFHQPHFNQPRNNSSNFTNRHIVPFFKSGRLSLREPEMFHCLARKVPLITQGTQTGQDSRDDELASADKPYLPADPKYADVNPKDGKGGFPVSLCSQKQSFHSLPIKRSVAEDSYKGFTEGDGYAKRGNSKTVVSPSFGEATARAVMTTSIGDNATVVTVAIMSRQSATMKPRLVNSTHSPRPSTSSDNDGDLKENMETPVSDNLDSVTSLGIQTRRGRRPNSVTMPAMSSRGRTLRKRTNPDNISIEDDANFEIMMEERKEKARAAEQERMEISIRIDDSQCISYGEQKRWQCELCDKSYTTKHNLVMHMLDHNGIKPHLCLVCGKYFKQLSHLNTHMLTHDKVRPHVCPTCGKGFTQISHLKRHQAVHQDTKPYCCDLCGRGFTFPSELRIHKERHVSGRLATEHCCGECGEEFTTASLLKQHELTHEKRSSLTCSYCTRSFRYPSQLRDHIVIHSNSRPYMCTECGMDFMKEHHLRSHQFTHTGLRPYSCPVCNRSFNQRANMQRHMLIHKAERSYKCEFCEKTFTQPQTLKAHMVVHADHKPYQCNLCGKEFGRLHNLHGHMHMHNNSKPYICFCGSSFTLKGNLNRHKKVKHGLNESTESMEEDAVHFLSSWSERAREERSGDDTMDGCDANGNADGNIDGNDVDGSSLDVMDKSSSRKQRKSIPRKILRHSSSARKKNSASNTGEDEQDEEDEGDDEPEEEEATIKSEQFPSLHFQALTDDANTTLPMDFEQKRQTSEDYAHELEANETNATTPKRSCRERASHFASVQNGDFVAGLSDSDKEDGEQEESVDDDAEWLPGEARQKNGKGAKLDSLIAEKFKNS